MAEGEQAVKIRRITDVHADFDEGPDQNGTFYFLFILDDGAEEYVMQPSIDAGRLLMQMISAAETKFLDTERGRIMLRELD